jgi:hypothetical protein
VVWCVVVRRESTGRLPGPSDVPAVSHLTQTLLAENGISEDMLSLTDVDVVRDVCLVCWGQSLPVCSIIGE